MDDHPIGGGDAKKRCPACGREKPLNKFYEDTARKDGYSSICKKCHGKSVKKWQTNNLERFKEINRRWKKAHKKQRAAESKKWAEDHPDHKREVGKAWRAGNPDYGKNWREKNRDKTKNYEQVRRARLAEVRSDLTIEEWEAVLDFYGHRCLCCGKENVKLTIDHVLPISMGGTHTVDNVQPLCGPCNSRKHANHIDYRKELYAPPSN
jgi:hypothetical protein